MASARKQFNPKRRAPGSEHLYSAFIGDLLLGDVVATRLHEQKNGQGRLIRLDYDDPNGNGQGGGQGRTLATTEAANEAMSARARAPRKAPAKRPTKRTP